MTTQIKRRRGTTLQHSTFAGAEAEITIDTDKNTVVVHDGSTAGGHPLAKASEVVAKAGDAMTGNLSFADSNKAIFGAGSDLQIYHDAGGDSYIKESGTGNLYLEATNLRVKSANNETYIAANQDGAVTLYYDNAAKLATTNTGVDVTGNTLSDSLTANGSLSGLNAGSVMLDYSGLSTSRLLAVGADATTTGILKVVSTASDGGPYIEAMTISSTGVNVTGTISSDGLTVDGATQIDQLQLDDGYIRFQNATLQTPLGAAIYRPSGTADLNIMLGSVNCAKFANGGDISFYEDTGTTPKFFWDASAERLGIGTSSPSRALNVYSTQQTVSLFEGSGATSQIEIKNSVSQSAIVASSADLYFYVNSAERMRIDSSGNVGIGSSVISGVLQVTGSDTVEGDAKGQIVIRDSAAYNASPTMGIIFQGEHTTGSQANMASIYGAKENATIGNYAGYLGFATRAQGSTAAERMRITSSGNVGIGTSSPASILHLLGTDPKITLGVSGSAERAFLQYNNATSLLNLDSDGGTTFATNNTERMRIDSSGNVLCGSDGGGDIGSSTKRFKDLYLSGGVYLGGTGAANKLDDYETGTWTPVIADAVSGGNTSPTTAASAIYTKIGNLVTIQMNIQNIDTTGMTGANDIHILGLPFTAISLSGSSYFTGALRAGALTFTGNVSVIAGDSSSHLQIAETSSGSGSDLVTVGEISSGSTDFWFSLTYTAA
jgi:hypothetical protein